MMTDTKPTVHWNTMHKHLHPGPRYFDSDNANKLFNRIHSKDSYSCCNSLEDISQAFDRNIMPSRTDCDKSYDNENENTNSLFTNNNNSIVETNKPNGPKSDGNLFIEYEYKSCNNKEKSDTDISIISVENTSQCPCCDSIHNIDDNINTHLSEISKLYNLNRDKEWKKFLLLPMDENNNSNNNNNHKPRKHNKIHNKSANNSSHIPMNMNMINSMGIGIGLGNTNIPMSMGMTMGMGVGITSNKKHSHKNINNINVINHQIDNNHLCNDNENNNSIFNNMNENQFNGFRIDKPLRLRIVSVASDNVCLEWNNPEFEADKYFVFMKPAHMQVQGTNNNNKGWCLVYQGDDRTYTVPNLLGNTTYLFRARYQCLYGLSPYNTAKKCKTLPSDKDKGNSDRKYHPIIMSNIQILAKQKELKKQQRKNKKERERKREDLKAKQEKQALENKRKKEAANKRKKIKAKQKAMKRRKEEQEKKELEKQKQEKEKTKLYEQALIERLKQIEVEKEREEKEKREREAKKAKQKKEKERLKKIKMEKEKKNRERIKKEKQMKQQQKMKEKQQQQQQKERENKSENNKNVKGKKKKRKRRKKKKDKHSVRGTPEQSQASSDMYQSVRSSEMGGVVDVGHGNVMGGQNQTQVQGQGVYGVVNDAWQNQNQNQNQGFGDYNQWQTQGHDGNGNEYNHVPYPYNYTTVALDSLYDNNPTTTGGYNDNYDANKNDEIEQVMKEIGADLDIDIIDNDDTTGGDQEILQNEQERNMEMRNWVQQSLNIHNNNNNNRRNINDNNNNNNGDFIFHLPAGMVDFNDNDTYSNNSASGVGDTNTNNTTNTNVISGSDDQQLMGVNQKDIVKNVWANTINVSSDNPYSLQNYAPYKQQQIETQITQQTQVQQVQNADLYLYQNIHNVNTPSHGPLQQQMNINNMNNIMNMSPQLNVNNASSGGDINALETIHSLMRQTNFVDTESYYTKLSTTGQKQQLEDMQFEEENDKKVNENDVIINRDMNDDNGNGNSEDTCDQKEIQRGPRFKHHGHDRRHQMHHHHQHQHKNQYHHKQ